MIASNLLTDTIKQHGLYPDTGKDPQPSGQQWAYAMGQYMGDLCRAIDRHFGHLRVGEKLDGLDAKAGSA